MGKSYRVIDLKPADGSPAEFILEAGNPEEAAFLALGLHLVRAGQTRNLRAKVYFGGEASPTMVRLYTGEISAVTRRNRELGF